MNKADATIHLIVLIGGFVVTWTTGNLWWAVGGYVLFCVMPSKVTKP